MSINIDFYRLRTFGKALKRLFFIQWTPLRKIRTSVGEGDDVYSMRLNALNSKNEIVGKESQC